MSFGGIVGWTNSCKVSHPVGFLSCSIFMSLFFLMSIMRLELYIALPKTQDVSFSYFLYSVYISNTLLDNYMLNIMIIRYKY